MPLGKRIDNNSAARQADISGTLQNGNTPQPGSNSIKAKVNIEFEAEEPRYGFQDIILNPETYDSIQDVLTVYEKRKMIFEDWGLSQTHKKQDQIGINLYGVSGTGKTMSAHAIAKQLGRKILIVDYSKIESKYVGETSKNLVQMFEYAKEQNAIIFFDEADALLSKRVTDMSSSTDVSVNQTRSVLLALLNDYNNLILFATNFISNYDPAFMRRIFSHIKFDYPNETNRYKLWDLYIPKQLPNNANLKELSSKYDMITGSDISNAVFAASIRAARLNEGYVQHKYFEDAVEKILKSRQDNDSTAFAKRIVSTEYVKTQFGGELPK